MKDNIVKMVCIGKMSVNPGNTQYYEHLEIGNVYDLVEFFDWYRFSEQVNGVNVYVLKCLFITLEEHRDKQLERIFLREVIN